jgi:hypothetical protein
VLVLWLLHRTPIRFPPNATSVEMSSTATVAFVPPVVGMVNGVPHVVPLPVPLFVMTVPVVPLTLVQVAQTVPAESRSMVSDSLLFWLMTLGKPELGTNRSVVVLYV